MTKSSLSPQKFSCMAVDQPIGTFFLCSIHAPKILELLTVERRGLSLEDRMKVQRALDPKRQEEIANYARRDNATFPTSVTVSADSEFVHIIDSTSELVIGIEVPSDGEIAPEEEILEIGVGKEVRRFRSLPKGSKIAQVIDGQHRVEGLRLAEKKFGIEVLNRFDLSFAFLFDLSSEEMAKIFVTINSTQRKVDSSHIADLFSLSTKRSPLRTCHLIAEESNNADKGPFQNGLKMLGKRQLGSEMLSQGSFCKYLAKLITKNSDDDERRLELGENLTEDLGRPLRNFFIKNEDEVIYQIVSNYFSAVAKMFPLAWDTHPEEFLLRKTVGFAALTKLLGHILPFALNEGNASVAAFKKVFQLVAEEYTADYWSAQNFSSSEAEATKMYKKMLIPIEIHLNEIFKKPK